MSGKPPFDAQDGRRAGYGLTFVAIVAGLLPLVAAHPPRWSALGIAAAAAVLTTATPTALIPLARFGRMLTGLLTMTAVGLAYFAVLTPASLLGRMLGREPLALRPDRTAGSYWIVRSTPGTDLRRQF